MTSYALGFSFVLSLVAVAVTASAATPDLVVVVHRHGARMPALPFNETILCPTLPCGALTPEGKDMLRSLGSYMAARYPGQFPTTSLDPYTAYTRSTSVTRTIQSADAFLRGGFPNLTAFYPAIENVPIAEDTLLDPFGSWPSNQMHSANSAMEDAKNEAVAAYAASLGINSSVLTAFGVETLQYALCPAFPLFCSFAAQDLAESLKSRGQLDPAVYPYLFQYNDRLNAVVEFMNRLKFQYNASEAQWLGTGSLGQELAMSIIGDATMYAAGAVTWNLKEYSAHDTTLMPLYASLGITDEMRPKFAEAVIFEFYVAPLTSAVSLSARRGYPEQTPGPHTYTFQNLSLWCVTSSGTLYSSFVCPLDDFQRGVARFNPTPVGGGVGGKCYFSPADQAAGCPASPAQAPDPSTQPICIAFRTACPSEACPAGYLLDFSTFACVLV